MPDPEIVEFMRPRLCGARFEGAAIPLEVLKDLAVLEEMIIEVAKWRFLESNPSRTRSPKGFTDGIELKLTGVEDGSAIPVICLALATGTLPGMPVGNQTYFEEAREAIVSAIDAAEQSQPITEHLPDKALGYFDRIGRSLRGDEAIEFTTPAHTTPAHLTRETRRKLVLASSRVREVTEEVTIRGSIPEADQDDMTFELQLINGHKVGGPLPDQHLETILAAFADYRNGARVIVQGIGKFNRQNRLVGLEQIEHLGLLDTLDVPARLDELRELKAGWLEGQGFALSGDGLDWLSNQFDRRFPEDLPLPCAYPTAEGDVLMEWSIGGTEASLEVNLSTYAAEWHTLVLETNAEETLRLDLREDQAWGWLAERVGGLAGASA